jgi:tRNA 2-thiouridine synthesizing protein A
MRTDDLDATGLLCPLPVLKLRKRLSTLSEGDCIKMRADDPAAIIDVPHFCAEAGHTLVEMSEVTDAQLYLVRKGGQPVRGNIPDHQPT